MSKLTDEFYYPGERVEKQEEGEEQEGGRIKEAER